MSRTPNASPDADDTGTPALAPPPWAARSVPEDGGITHEHISRIRPIVQRWTRDGYRPAQTEVSVSTVDRQAADGWTRDTPTVQVEGGSYTFDGARQLRAALDDILAHAGIEQPAVPEATDAGAPTPPARERGLTSSE